MEKINLLSFNILRYLFGSTIYEQTQFFMLYFTKKNVIFLGKCKHL